MNKRNTVSYIGVTGYLSQRIWEHKQKLVKGFTEKYNLTELVYYELFDFIYDAIEREKQLKRWSRAKKLILIRRQNPTLKDISSDLQ